MNQDIKRLAVVSMFCFFPTALIGWLLMKKSEGMALRLFNISIYIFLILIATAGAVVVIKGGAIIKVLVSIY